MENLPDIEEELAINLERVIGGPDYLKWDREERLAYLMTFLGTELSQAKRAMFEKTRERLCNEIEPEKWYGLKGNALDGIRVAYELARGLLYKED